MEKVIFDQIIDTMKQRTQTEPIFVGVHGPQGCGKSISCENVKKKLHDQNISCLTISLDDFYYPYKKMKHALCEFRDNLYNQRGLAGTHDTKWLKDFLTRIKQGENAVLPKFNKSLHKGFGDVDEYIPIHEHYDVVILEGWMIGYKPRQFIPSYLRTFNKELEKYQFLHDLFDTWLYFETDKQNIYDWRFNTETTMDKETFDEFIKPFFIIYSNYLIGDENNKYVLDKNRNIIE